MKDLICDEFQNLVADTIIRHHSILDIMSKISESSARINRAVTKSVTSCGCVSLEAKKLDIPKFITSLEDLKPLLDKHLRGELCFQCEEKINEEIGRLLYYIAALCNTLDISFYDILIEEYKKTRTLGSFNLT